MEIYVIIGFVLAVLGVAIWLTFKAMRGAVRREQAETKAAAHEAEAQAWRDNDKLRRELEEAGGSWETYDWTTETTTAPPANSKTTKVIQNPQSKNSGGSLPALVFLALALCIGSTACTRTVYVERPLPVIPVGPALNDGWNCDQWQQYARTLRAKVDHYNEAAAP